MREADVIVETTLARRAQVDKRHIEKLIQEMASNWESLEPEVDPGVDAAERSRFLAVWQEHREVFGYTLLQELPYALRNALTQHPNLEGADFDVLVVDEYQDLNACDLAVLRLIGDRGCAVIGAGDDDQSIYSFRRAAPEGIRRFLQDYSGAAAYTLSVSLRCGRRIIDWARWVIEADPDRPRDRPELRPADDAPDGEVALLSFASNVSEPRGIAALAKRLRDHEGIAAREILILLRGDYNKQFSRHIKAALDAEGIAYADPDAIKELLADVSNRRMMAVFRLLSHREDSLAWATLLQLCAGVGGTFIDYVYNDARGKRGQFGAALLELHQAGFPEVSLAVANRVRGLMDSVLEWLDGHQLPEGDETRWGEWILSVAGGDVAPHPTDDLRRLLTDLDELVEAGSSLDRFLGQVTPLGKDLTVTQSEGVRIMTMMGSKGLTVRATIIGAVEDEIIPLPVASLAEERRLLYVAMTRSKEFLYCTWARRRTGQTARSGAAGVQTSRNPCRFLRDGPVQSVDGMGYIRSRWGE